MLFLVVMNLIMEKSTDYIGAGIPWTDHDRLANLDFVYDVALLVEDDMQLQVAQEVAKVRLQIKAEKLKSMPVGLVGPIGWDCQQHTPWVHK